MQLRVENDCKGKSQSFEAKQRDINSGVDSLYCLDLTGYGATQDEAIEEYKSVVADLKSRLTELLEKLDSVEYEADSTSEAKRRDEVARGMPQGLAYRS